MVNASRKIHLCTLLCLLYQSNMFQNLCSRFTFPKFQVIRVRRRLMTKLLKKYKYSSIDLVRTLSPLIIHELVNNTFNIASLSILKILFIMFMFRLLIERWLMSVVLIQKQVKIWSNRQCRLVWDASPIGFGIAQTFRIGKRSRFAVCWRHFYIPWIRW